MRIKTTGAKILSLLQTLPPNQLVVERFPMQYLEAPEGPYTWCLSYTYINYPFKEVGD